MHINTWRTGISFNNGDLFGAFHKATLDFSLNNKSIYCVLTDKYDFAYESNWWSLTNFANNYSYFSQLVGASNSYYITVVMKFKRNKK